MQSIWDDFVAQRTVIKQMVSPTSTAEHGLYMSWGETGYATQESALHRLLCPHTFCMTWCGVSAWPPSVHLLAAHRHSAVPTWLAAAQGPADATWATEHWGTGHKRSTGGDVFCAALPGRFHPAWSVASWYLLFFLLRLSVGTVCVNSCSPQYTCPSKLCFLRNPSLLLSLP